MKKSTHWRTLNNLTNPIRYSIPAVSGLHLWVRADKKKYWIFRFTFSGRRYDMSLGSFPAVKLSDAKVRALRLRGEIFNGKNPADLRKEEKSRTHSVNKGLRFVILNACRVGEAIQADVSQIRNDVWVIPAERMKARREHQIPLTDESLKIIKLARAMSSDSPCIFS